MYVYMCSAVCEMTWPRAISFPTTIDGVYAICKTSILSYATVNHGPFLTSKCLPVTTISIVVAVTGDKRHPEDVISAHREVNHIPQVYVFRLS